MSKSPSLTRPVRRRLSKKRTAAALAVLGATALTATVGGLTANAAVPTFPNNLVVFPDRDFVTIEGYQDHLGELATVEVTRAGTVIGSAQSRVAEGDVAFEINHPGGVCWGAGTGLDVTPDIRPGDKVTIKFDGDNYGDTTVQDTFVTQDAELNGSTVTVTGYVGASVNRAQMEQRIINPDLTDTAIGRRDVRAVPGPLTPSDKGGYSSALTFNGNTFTATYVFDNASDAALAADAPLGERSMAWQEEDADANRQGLTIAEFGEPGGPGMGGCPAGPGDAGAPKPGTASVVRSEDKTSLQVSWAPATQVPTAEPVSGYSVDAIADSASAEGHHVVVGRRTPADATRTTISGLSASESYDVEVRSIAGPEMSPAFVVQVPGDAPNGDITPPELTATPAPSATEAVETKEITLASETDADIYFTLDGSPVISGGLPTNEAQLYTGPIPVTEALTLKAVVFDRAGNQTLLTADYKPPAAPDPAPDAPTDFTGTAGQASVSLRWTTTQTNVVGYGVQAYNEAGDKVGALVETTAKNITINGLTANTSYFFTVKAKNAGGYGVETAKLGPLTPTQITDRVTIGVARWKQGDFRVTGTASVVGAIVTVRPAKADGTIDRTRSLGSALVTAAAAPDTGGEYDIRLRNGAAPATNPGRIFVESNGGGVAGPFVVANS